MTQEELNDAVIRTNELVLDMHHRLFGNGQPGELARLQGEINTLKESRSKLIGALAAVSVAGGLIGTLHMLGLIGVN